MYSPVTTNRFDKELKKAAKRGKDLNKIKKDVKNKRIKIKLANTNTPNIKLSPIQKLIYRKTKYL